MDSARWRTPSTRVHGGVLADELAELGLLPSDVLDFSINVNPYGPSSAVVDAIRAAAVELYPDPAATAVRKAIAARTEVPIERIVFGSGAANLLWTVTRVLLSCGGRALVVEPAFSEFRAAVEATGASLYAWKTGPEQGFAVDLEAVEGMARRVNAEVVYLCAPTTPAGVGVPLAAVAELARRLPGMIVLLDESFLSLSDQSAEAREPMPSNVVRLRSMTKEHAIPGVRVGYLLAPAALAYAVEASRPAWSTSSIAQAAAVAALDANEFVAASRDQLRRDREATVVDLATLGLTPIPSVAPYLVFRVGDATSMRRRLLTHRILVRDCASFGLPGFVRVAARPASDRIRLIAALEKELR
jgi:histidinol-phosphate/aromatic aminotransferase/cobyric acid decarboxylase-like protein